MTAKVTLDEVMVDTETAGGGNHRQKDVKWVITDTVLKTRLMGMKTRLKRLNYVTSPCLTLPASLGYGTTILKAGLLPPSTTLGGLEFE